MQSRYYNPEWGRFINVDGLLSSNHLVGLNLFAYCLNNPVNMVDSLGNMPKWVLGLLNVVGGTAQAAAGAALGAAIGWTGAGLVPAVFLVANGAATATQGVGQIVNYVAGTTIMHDENIIRTGAQTIGSAIGGDTGASVACAAYDIAGVAASIYAGKVALQQAGKIPIKVKISSLSFDPSNPMTDEGINYWTRTLCQSGGKGYNTIPNAYGAVEPICVQKGTLIIANGHHRVEVLKALGIEEIYVFLVP